FHCFFFQAEDVIRDRNVTGVQTCALPIFSQCTRNVLLHRGHYFEEKKYPFSWCGLSLGRHLQIILATKLFLSLDCLSIDCFSWEIGRASCRERVLVSVDVVTLREKVIYLL